MVDHVVRQRIRHLIDSGAITPLEQNGHRTNWLLLLLIAIDLTNMTLRLAGH